MCVYIHIYIYIYMHTFARIETGGQSWRVRGAPGVRAASQMANNNNNNNNNNKGMCA